MSASRCSTLPARRRARGRTGCCCRTPRLRSIGASGAVAGVSAAYLVLHPKVSLWTLVLYRIPLPLPAWIPLGVWVATQFVMIVRDPFGPVSWAAHVGGILAGIALVLVMRRPGVPLFDRRVLTPDAAVLAPRGEPVRSVPWGR